ncbi:Uncharacterised protein [Chlamydia trachomatis]|nr:Uncharacterised protein [Chlamydia trachomatis]
MNFRTSVKNRSKSTPTVKPITALENIDTVATVSASFLFFPPNKREI